MRRQLALVSGFLVSLVWLVMLVAGGALWMWQDGIHDRVEALRSERFRFSLMDMKATLEAGLRLGNSTADLTGTGALVAQVRDRQPDILSIDVYDAQGDVLFSTDPSGRGLKLPPAWRQPCLNPDTTGWAGLDADGGVQCVGLVNAFGQPAGGVLLRHRYAARTTADLRLPTDWPGLAAMVIALMGLTAWAAARVVRPLHQQAHALRAQLDELYHTPAPPDVSALDTLGPAHAALAALQAHDRWLRETDAEADRLDAQEAA
ncbi:MAG: hypothetical protein K2W33_13145 [Burkholderiales bacterium]|nr:hypothetical protein [Burkholderiales bacterium]